jgi:hypothetical protein
LLAQAISGAPAMSAAAAQPGASAETKEGSERFLAEAAAAFKLVCDINAEHIVGVPHASLLSLIAHSAALPLAQRMDVVAGVSYVIADLPTTDAVTASLAQVATPLMQQLAALTAAASSANCASRDAMVTALKLLSAVVQFCKLDPRKFVGIEDGRAAHPVAELVKAAWPTLELIATSFGDDASANVVEALCRFVKYALKNCKRALLPILSPIVTLLVVQVRRSFLLFATLLLVDSSFVVHYSPSLLNLLLSLLIVQFQATTHSGYLYVLSIAIGVFGDLCAEQPSAAETFLAMITAVSQRTFALFSTGRAAMVEHPDVVDDYYRMVVQVRAARTAARAAGRSTACFARPIRVVCVRPASDRRRPVCDPPTFLSPSAPSPPCRSYIAAPAQVITSMPTLLVGASSAPLLNSAVQCALCALTFQHREANRTVLRFLDKLFAIALPAGVANPRPAKRQAEMLPTLQALFGAVGEQVVAALIAGVGGVLHITHVAEDKGCIADTLRVVLLLDGERLRVSLVAALDAANTKGLLLDGGKAAFLRDLFGLDAGCPIWRWRRVMSDLAEVLQPHFKDQGRGH